MSKNPPKIIVIAVPSRASFSGVKMPQTGRQNHLSRPGEAYEVKACHRSGQLLVDDHQIDYYHRTSLKNHHEDQEHRVQHKTYTFIPSDI